MIVSYIIEFGAFELMVWPRNWEQFYGDPEIVQVLCPDCRGRAQRLAVAMGVIIVRYDEQPPGQKIRGFGGEYLIRTEQDIGHGDPFC